MRENGTSVEGGRELSLLDLLRGDQPLSDRPVCWTLDRRYCIYIDYSYRFEGVQMGDGETVL